jgi:pimeloyl-ACP methyl ester carboxylesterase
VTQIHSLKEIMMLTEQSVRLRNGATLRYVEQGTAGALPIILLHGFPDSWRSYETVLAHLPHSIRVIALSQRGLGNSDKPDAGYRPHDLAGDLDEFMAAREIPEAFIVGHSMGALVAQRFAIDHPERVAGLALIGTFNPQVCRDELADLVATVDKMEGSVDVEFVRAFQASTRSQPVPDAFFKVVVAKAHGCRSESGDPRPRRSRRMMISPSSRRSLPRPFCFGANMMASRAMSSSRSSRVKSPTPNSGSMPAPATACSGRSRNGSPAILSSSGVS